MRIRFVAATDDRAVAGYRVAVSRRRTVSLSTTAVILDGLSCGRTYRISVWAVDTSGNVSRAASTVARTAACVS